MKNITFERYAEDGCFGGGGTNISIINCHFENNYARCNGHSLGGAITLANENPLNYNQIINCTFDRNYIIAMGIDNVNLYTDFYNAKQNLTPILSFNIKNMHSEEVADMLSDVGICVRAGLHCAPLAHNKFGTQNTGTVRISPSIFTKKSDIDFLIKSVIKIAKSK